MSDLMFDDTIIIEVPVEPELPLNEILIPGPQGPPGNGGGGGSDYDDTELRELIADEEAARIAMDNNFVEGVSATFDSAFSEIEQVVNNLGTLQTDLDGEISARINAINDEINERVNALNDLKSEILGNAPAEALDTLKELGDLLLDEQDAVASLTALVADKLNSNSPRVPPDPSAAADFSFLSVVFGSYGLRTLAQTRSDLGLQAAAYLGAPAYGGTADNSQVVLGGDPRMTNIRTPTTHAASHLSGGQDEIANATVSAKGMMSAADKIKLDSLALRSVEPMDSAVGSWRSTILPGTHTSVGVSSSMLNSSTQVTATPIWVGRTTTFDRMGIYLSTPATDVGAVLEMGWCPSGADGGPDLTNLSVGGQTAITGVAAGLKEIIVPAILTRGIWWILSSVVTSTTAGTNPIFYANTGVPWINAVAMDSNNYAQRWYGVKTSSTVGLTGITSVVYGSALAGVYLRAGMRVSSY